MTYIYTKFDSILFIKCMVIGLLTSLLLIASNVGYSQLSARGNTWADVNKVKNAKSIAVLATYLYHENDQVRLQIAKHPLVENRLLSVLAKDKSWKIRRQVAMYQDLDLDIVNLLITDPKPKVRATIAEHPLLFTTHLEKLAEDESSAVRKIVASTLRTPIVVLKQLANDKSKKVRQAAKETLGQ